MQILKENFEWGPETCISDKSQKMFKLLLCRPYFMNKEPVPDWEALIRVAIMVNKRVRNAVLGCNLKNDRMISVHFQGKPLNVTVIQVYAPTSNAEEAEVERFYEDLQDLLELTPQKRCPFHYRGLECRSRKSRNTWSNRQIAEWNMAKANRVLPRECTGHSKHPLPTTQEKTLHMDITRWSTPKSDWLYSLQPKMEKLYTVNKNRTRSWLRSLTPYCKSQT